MSAYVETSNKPIKPAQYSRELDNAVMAKLANLVSAELSNSAENVLSLKGLFLLPFKKGHWRRMRNETEAVVNAAQHLAESLVQEFKQNFQNSRHYLPLQLVIHKTHGGNYIRWRGTICHKQVYTDLGAVECKEILQALSPSVRAVFLAYERCAIQLNLALSLSRHRLRTINAVLRDIEKLSELEDELEGLVLTDRSVTDGQSS